MNNYVQELMCMSVYVDERFFEFKYIKQNPTRINSSRVLDFFKLKFIVVFLFE